MANLDHSKSLLDASAGAATDWGSVEVGADIEFSANLEASRGIEIDLGVGALAQLNGSLQKFVSADVQGSAQAEARVTAQIQVPMDLFDEAGLAVRLQAIAQAAAGVQIRLGLSIGDFVALIDADPKMAGLPAKLARAFLEEIDIGGGLYAKAAVAAMAYANLVVAGRLIAKGATKPGFTISAEAGAGLKAGAGFRVFANLQIKDPRRLVGRSIDLAVNEMTTGLARLLPPDDATNRVVLDAARAALKIGLRNAFEIGELIATGQAAQSAAGADQMALRCVQVIMEEAQRYIMEKLAQSGLVLLQQRLTALQASVGNWNGARAERVKLAGTLAAIPDEPFRATPEVLDFWTLVADDAIALAEALQGQQLDTETQRHIATLWAAAQIGFVAVKQTADAAASVAVIGLAPRQRHRSFSQGLTTPNPPPQVKRAINAALGHVQNASVGASELVDFLLSPAVLDPIVGANPGLALFLDTFRGAFGGNAGSIATTLIRNIGSLDVDGTGPDPRKTLIALGGALTTFLEQKIEVELTEAVRPVLAEHDDLRLYYDNVALPALRLTTDLVFDAAVHWNEGPLTPKTMTEALSSILLLIFGRTLVVSADLLLVSGQRALAGELNALAQIIAEDRNDPRNLLPILSPLTPLSRADLAELISETLKIAGDVFGPMPDELRAKIRTLLYEIIETLPPGEPAMIAEQLSDTLFIPNVDLVRELALEMAGYAGSSFAEFVQRVLLRLAQMVLEELLEVIDAAARQVGEWIEDLAQAVQALERQLAELAAEIAQMVEDVQRQFDEALGNLLDVLESFSSQSARDHLRTGLVDLAVQEAVGVLRDIPGYSNLPSEVRSAARSAVRSAVRAVVNNVLRDPVLEGLAAVASEVDDLVEDVRGLDPARNLTSQLEDLILDRIEDAVRAAFGGDNPRISIEIVVGSDPFKVRFDLGRVRVPLGQIISAVRSVVGSVGAFEDALRDVAQDLADAFAAEAALNEREGEKSRVEEQHTGAKQQLTESTPGDLAVEIVAPTPGGAYARDIDVKLHVAGAPLSFAGRGANEKARILVFLDQGPVDLATFEIEELTVPDGAATVPILAPPAIGSPTRGGVSLQRALLGNVGSARQQPIVGMRLAPNEQLGVWGARSLSRTEPNAAAPKSTGLSAHWATRAVSQQRARTAKVHAVRKGEPARTVPADHGTRIQTMLGGAGKVDGAQREPPPIAGRFSACAPRVGRTLRLTEIAAVGSALGSGLLLTRRIRLAGLDDGLHTLVVSVVDGRGQKISQSVAFFAVNAEPPPGRPGRPRRGAGASAPEKPIHLPDPTGTQKPAKPKKSRAGEIFPAASVRSEAVGAAKQAIAKPAKMPMVIVQEHFAALKAARRFETFQRDRTETAERERPHDADTQGEQNA